MQDTVVKMQDMGLDSKRFGIIKKKDGTYKFNFFLNADITEIKKNLATLKHPILAVFVDSLRGATATDENDPKIKNAMQNLNAIICDNHKAALIYIHHWKKGHTTDLLDKVIGTTAITSSVRQILGIIKKSGYVRLIKQAKSNIGLCSELEMVMVGDDIVIRQPTEESSDTQANKAEKFLIELFKDTDSVQATDGYKWAEEEGIGEEVIKKARKKLGIESKTEGIGKAWYWYWELHGK